MIELVARVDTARLTGGAFRYARDGAGLWRHSEPPLQDNTVANGNFGRLNHTSTRAFSAGRGVDRAVPPLEHWKSHVSACIAMQNEMSCVSDLCSQHPLPFLVPYICHGSFTSIAPQHICIASAGRERHICRPGNQ